MNLIIILNITIRGQCIFKSRFILTRILKAFMAPLQDQVGLGNGATQAARPAFLLSSTNTAHPLCVTLPDPQSPQQLHRWQKCRRTKWQLCNRAEKKGSTFPFIKGAITRPSCRRTVSVTVKCWSPSDVTHPKGCQIWPIIPWGSAAGSWYRESLGDRSPTSPTPNTMCLAGRQWGPFFYSIWHHGRRAQDTFVYVRGWWGRSARQPVELLLCGHTNRMGFLERDAEQLLLWRCLHHCACVSAAVTLSPVPVAHRRGLIPSFSIIFFPFAPLPLLPPTFVIFFLSLSVLPLCRSELLIIYLVVPLPSSSSSPPPARPPSTSSICFSRSTPSPPPYPALPLLLFFSPPFPHPQCSSVWIARMLL